MKHQETVEKGIPVASLKRPHKGNDSSRPVYVNAEAALQCALYTTSLPEQRVAAAFFALGSI